MRKFIIRIAAGLLLALITLAPLGPATSQEPSLPEACRELAFSTEEDFVTWGPKPPDGNPIISDGDLLGPNCEVCARNLDLVGRFDVSDDLGLDAADVIDVESYLVAFSTELDSPNTGQFTAGDLLVTNGAIIANVALTHLFEVGYDIGLDAIHFVGDTEKIIAFLDAAKQYSREYWLENPANLAELLASYEIDIWFSTEGTLGPVEAPIFLDGDLLSARYGTIVALLTVISSHLRCPPASPLEGLTSDWMQPPATGLVTRSGYSSPPRSSIRTSSASPTEMC